MRLDDDFDNYYEDDIEEYKNKNSQSTLYTFVAATVIVMVVVLCVLLANNTGSRKASTSSSVNGILTDAEAKHREQMESEKSVNELLSGSTLTADDLDFWDDYPDESKYSKKDEEALDLNKDSDKTDEVDPSKDGKHTLIKYADGKEEWVDINPYVRLNEYNFNNLVYQSPLMKYYVNNHKESFVGVDLSKQEGYVDFSRLKSAGVDYVMIRIGQRGYYSGEITVDENFADNLWRASDAGLGVGVYFYSQATTVDEAIDEADFVLQTLSMNSVDDDGNFDDNLVRSKVRYPVVFYMEDIVGDESRTDNLSQMARTNIAKAFMDRIEESGYSPMLYGNKEWLIKKYSFASLEGYDIWLSESEDVPTFPYRFQMWNYTKSAKIGGLASDASLSISFIDYSTR